MNRTAAIAAAISAGWTEDRPLPRHRDTLQISTERNGVLGFIKIPTQGPLHWTSSVYPDSAAAQDFQPRTGTAPTLDRAIQQCEGAMSEANGVLF